MGVDEIVQRVAQARELGYDSNRISIALKEYVHAVADSISAKAAERGESVIPRHIVITARVSEQLLNPFQDFDTPILPYLAAIPLKYNGKNPCITLPHRVNELPNTHVLFQDDQGSALLEVKSRKDNIHSSDLSDARKATRKLFPSLVQAYNGQRNGLIGDNLTKLPNRAAIDLFIPLYFANQSQPLTLYSLDISGLKAVNDIYGHQFGNKLLGSVASSLRELITRRELIDLEKDEYMISRVGGDEFHFSMPNEKEPQKVADEIRKLFAENTVQLPAKETSPKTLLTPRAGIGWAELQGGQSVRRAWAQAESMMHIDQRVQRELFIREHPNLAPAIEKRNVQT